MFTQRKHPGPPRTDRALRSAVLCGSFVLWFALARPARANPADTFGFGSRSIAMGGAVSAGVSDTSANYYNPAGLAFAERTELSLGRVHVAPEFSLAGRDSGIATIDAWQFGLIVPGEILHVPVAFGLASQLSGKRIARVVTYTEDDQRWFLYEHRPEQLFLVANAAFKLTRNFSIGAGFGFLASTDGLLRISGTLVQPVAGASEYDSHLEHEVFAKLSGVRYPNLGVSWRLAPWLDLALTYRGQADVTLDVDSEISGKIQYGPLGFPTRYLLYSKTVQSWIPQQATLGLRWPALETLELHADLTWLDWSNLPSPVSATRSDLQIDTQGALIALPQLPPATRLESARAHDKLSSRVGAEWHEFGRVPYSVRLGYAHSPTALGADSSANLVDADAHLISLGAGIQPLWIGALGSLTVSMHTQLGLLSPRQVTSPDGNGTLRAAGHWFALGAELQLRL